MSIVTLLIFGGDISQKRKSREDENEEIPKPRKRKLSVAKIATEKNDDTGSLPEKPKSKHSIKVGSQVGRIIGKKRKERRKKASA